jgi:chromate reductase
VIRRKQMTMKILAISGSLRAASLNSALLRAARRLAPAGIDITLYDGMGTLPLFNPDLLESDPPAVAQLRAAVIDSAALLIASPEYAHGITGVMKNALDWLVGCEAFIDKPIALLNASPRASHAHASLREIVTVMSGRIMADATVAIVGAHLDEDSIAAHPEIAPALVRALLALRDGAATLQPAASPSYPVGRQ